MWLAALLTIPLHCVEPLLRVYEQQTPWMLGESAQGPYQQFVRTGRFEVEGCSVGLADADIVVDPIDAGRVILAYRKDQTKGMLDGWVKTMLTVGCVDLPGDIRVCLQGYEGFL